MADQRPVVKVAVVILTTMANRVRIGKYVCLMGRILFDTHMAEITLIPLEMTKGSIAESNQIENDQRSSTSQSFLVKSCVFALIGMMPPSG